ncbi:Thioredoxin-like fold [Artemisia annua]|uniref:Thioredoxin-like fold n=1 Tax=Artemisia annua TaxID=35608 RepID=A0A2U1PJK0_ARTAN|nr:Thioredoxin-like fold [Artemisia annua]
MSTTSDKLAQFQAITGLDDPDLCTEILTAHNWDLQQAISTITSSEPPENPETVTDTPELIPDHTGLMADHTDHAGPPGLAWKLITRNESYVAVNNAISEAVEFVREFEREYGVRHPNFVSEGFMDALQRSRNEFKLLFVYLHSPDHPDTSAFCQGSLCNEVVERFVNENFVAWGGSIRASEGFKMSNSLKASRFPFCAVVMAATNQRIALLQQDWLMLNIICINILSTSGITDLFKLFDHPYLIWVDASTKYILYAYSCTQAKSGRQVEGPKSPEEMLTMLQRVLEESAPVLVTARLDAEERRNNIRLREEQDAAYQAALEADQVLVRLPNGERKGRRFHSTATIQSLYDFVDSSGSLEIESYTLVTNFPRVLYGQDKLSLTLKEVGLHPQASLFVEMKS